TTIKSGAIGTVELSAGSSPAAAGDVVLAEVSGTTLSVGALTISATSDTDYTSVGQGVSNVVYGSTKAIVSQASISATAGAVSILADDSSTITATASSFKLDFDWLPVTASLHLSPSTAINIVNKEIEASVSNATVTAAGAIVVQAMNSMHVIGSAQTESLVPTGALTMASVSFGGTYVSNNLLGSISALVTDSTLTTTA